MMTTENTSIAPAALETEPFEVIVEWGDEARYRRLFCDVWDRVSTSDRVRMLTDWNGRRLRVVFTNQWKWRTICGWHHAKNGLAFDAEVVDAMPDQTTMILIAHELAHEVYFVTRPDVFKRFGEAGDIARLRYVAEAAANIIGYTWGFDRRILNAWLRTNLNFLTKLNNRPDRRALQSQVTVNNSV